MGTVNKGKTGRTRRTNTRGSLGACSSASERAPAVSRAKISVAFSSRGLRSPIPRDRARALARFFLAQARLELFFDEVSLLFTDDAGITPLNEAFVGHAGPTDVISFSLAPSIPGGRPIAEVVINVQQARREASRRGIDPAREAAWYLAHGIHHLAGAEDDTPDKRRAMHRIERAWLRAAENEGLL